MNLFLVAADNLPLVCLLLVTNTLKQSMFLVLWAMLVTFLKLLKALTHLLICTWVISVLLGCLSSSNSLFRAIQAVHQLANQLSAILNCTKTPMAQLQVIQVLVHQMLSGWKAPANVAETMLLQSNNEPNSNYIANAHENATTGTGRVRGGW